MTDLLELALSVAVHDPAAVAVEAARVLIDEVVSGGAVVELNGFGLYGEATYTQVWLRGYMSDTPAHARALQALRRRLLQYPQADLYGEVMIRHLSQQEWTKAWKQHYHTLRVGQRLVIAPAWEQPEVGAGDVVVWIEPGMAFGTGMHPSTRLALQLLERALQPGQEMLDVGTGSGILSIAALKLGGRHVWATDINPDAVAATETNARRNEVAAGLTTMLGSLPAQRPYPLVCVNILADVIVYLLLHQQLAEYVAADGVLVLSGIIVERRHVVDLALAACGMEIVETVSERDWRALAVRHLHQDAL